MNAGFNRPRLPARKSPQKSGKSETAKSRWVLIDVEVRNQNDEKVATGEAMGEFPRDAELGRNNARVNAARVRFQVCTPRRRHLRMGRIAPGLDIA